MCIGTIPAFIARPAISIASAILSKKLKVILFATTAILSALYWLYSIAIENNTNKAPIELTTIYLKPASTDFPLFVQNAINAQDAIDVISKKTKKLNRSPVKIMPNMPAIIRRISV